MTNNTGGNVSENPTLEHKVGLHNYARVGTRADDWIIIGAPNVRGKRWITLAHKFGGPTVSYPEAYLSNHFWVPSPTEK